MNALAEHRAFFRAYAGDKAADDRAQYIAALPRVDWKGKELCTVRCHGTTGKGPHDYNVPESVLWAHIKPDTHFLCPFHR